MTVEVKICGLKTQAAVDAALKHEADYLGFVFYPPSPRFVAPKQAAALVTEVPELVVKTGLVVDATDEMLDVIMKAFPMDMIQLHGNEPPERCDELRERFGVPICKALPIATKDDVRRAFDYENHVDLLLFDAKPPQKTKDGQEALPGGNGEAFDWSLMQHADFESAWMLSGGLTPQNVIRAIEMTDAEAVDVSSGVETVRGDKDPDLISAFLDIVHGYGAED